MNFEKWMVFEGNEIANDARTLSYIRNGLVPRWNSPGAECSCSAYDDGPYVDPDADDAPWFDENRPESKEFFGILIGSLRVSDPWARQVTPVGHGGGVLGPLYGRSRVVEVIGTMVASTRRGMRYGETWLGEVLAGGRCQPNCGTGDLCVLPACPEDPNDLTKPFRTLVLAGLVEGPSFTPVNEQIPEMYGQTVRWIMASGSPYLYSDEPVFCLDNATIDDDDPICCQILTDTWPGNETLVINVVSGNAPLDNLRVTVTPVLEGSDCPPSDRIAPCSDFTLRNMPAGTEAIVDGRTRALEVVQQVSRAYAAGLDVIQPPENSLFEFPDLGPCSTYCVCVEVLPGGTIGAGAKITVARYTREV